MVKKISILILVLIILILSSAYSTGVKNSNFDNKKTQKIIPEYLTDNNLLNKLEQKDATIASIKSTKLIPVIIILKNQPLHQTSREIKEEYETEMKSYETEINKILEKTKQNNDFYNEENIIKESKLDINNKETLFGKTVAPIQKIQTNSEKKIQESALEQAEENELKEQEMRKKGLSKLIEGERSVLTDTEKVQLNKTTKLIDSKNDEIKKRIYEVTTSKVETDQNKIMNLVNSCEGIITGKSTLISSVFARIPFSCLYDLKGSNIVLAVYENKIQKIKLDVSIPSTLATTWHSSGYTGGIWDLAVADTGIDGTHPALTVDFASVFHEDAQYETDYNDNLSSTDDLNGHGTHIAGIVTSTNSTYKGIAYGMDALINAKFGWLDDLGGGRGFNSDAMKSLDWAIKTAGADVISYSFGSSYTSSDDCSMCRFMDAIVDDLGISVAIAAGNDGPTSPTVGTPAIAYNAFSVANVDDQGTSSRADDIIATSSSRGPTYNGRVKPDIAAPGTGIKSAAYDWEGNLGLNPNFVEMSGTSMAAPHIAGAILLVLDYKGIRWDPKAIRALFFNTANDDGSFSATNDFGWGYIDLDHAYIHRDDVNLSTVTEGEYKFYKGTFLSGDKATLVWNRHVTYDNNNDPTSYYSLNDLDLYLYDESDNYLEDISSSSDDNVEQVEAFNTFIGVLKVDAFTTDFSHGSDTEDFALATEEGFSIMNGPNLSISQYVPSVASTLVNFTIYAYVDNGGDLKAHNVGVTLNLPVGLTILSGSQTQYFNISAGYYDTAVWIINATNGVGTYNNIYTNFSSYSYDELFTGSSASDSVDVIVRDSIITNNSVVVHNCSALYDSVLSIDSMSIPYPFIAGQSYDVSIDWTGWHYGDNNYWAFFLNDSTTPISTCTSYKSDAQYMAYSMNCAVNIPSNTSTGEYTFKTTANDYIGYCDYDEVGVDTQFAIITDVINIDNDEDGANYTIDCDDNNASILPPYSGMNITSNVKFCPGNYILLDSINIKANNLNVDCNHANINGNSSNNGIYIGFKSNIILTNCNLSNFKYGVWLVNADNNYFENNTISNSQYGFNLGVSENNQFVNNIILNNMNDGFSIGSMSHNNTLSGNIIDDNNYGISFLYSNNNIIKNNFIQNNNLAGIEMSFNSTNNLIYNNNFSSNSKGFHISYLAAVYNNSIWNNSIYDSNNVWDYLNQFYCVNNKSNIYHNNISGPSCPVLIDSYFPLQTNLNIAEPNNQTFNISKSDVDGTTPSVQWYLDGVSLSGQTNDTYIFIGNYSISGDYNITVIISDGYSLESHYWNFTVNNTNRAPTIDSYFPTNSSLNIVEPNNQSFNMTKSDLDGEQVNVFWYLDGNEVTNLDYFNFVGNFSSSGSYNVSVMVSDGGMTVSHYWNLTVNNTNRAPVLDTIQNITVNETDTVDINFSGNLNASDPDGDTISFTYSSPLNSSGKWLTTTSDAGIYIVIITVTDGNINVSQNVTINVLDVLDTDMDNIPDITDLDDDNDGIPDINDSVLGNSSNINSSNMNIIIEIDGSSNITKIIEGEKSVVIKDNTSLILEFDFNFSSSILALPNITIDKQNNSETSGFIIIKGLSLQSNKTKIAYFDRLNNDSYTICIKDAEIDTISNITALCIGEYETPITCPDTVSGYTCNITSNGTRYKITGLKHSGIKEQGDCGDNIIQNGEECDNTNLNGHSCTSKGFNKGSVSCTNSCTVSTGACSNDEVVNPPSGGGGAGGSSDNVCKTKWECSEWTDCENNKQIRSCELKDVDRYTTKEDCPTQNNKPETTQECESEEKQEQEENEESGNATITNAPSNEDKIIEPTTFELRNTDDNQTLLKKMKNFFGNIFKKSNETNQITGNVVTTGGVEKNPLIGFTTLLMIGLLIVSLIYKTKKAPKEQAKTEDIATKKILE